MDGMIKKKGLAFAMSEDDPNLYPSNIFRHTCETAFNQQMEKERNPSEALCKVIVKT